MLLDARSLPVDADLATQVCVVGAGAAGISLALEFAGANFDVTLVESGGFEADPAVQALYVGRNVGRPYFPLESSRTRAFGGSTHCWHGMCRPLDPIDFEERAWIPHSGWPFSRRDLLPYYHRAQKRCRLARFAYEGDDWADGPAAPLPLDASLAETRVFQVAPTRFGDVYRAAVTGAPNVTTLLHANVLEIVAGESARSIERLRVATLAGNTCSIRAEHFVLATGGIENARLLLASDRRSPRGLGNENDLVGRFFMEHPHVRAGALLPSVGTEALALYRPHRRGRITVMGCLVPSQAALRRERLASLTCWLGRPLASDGFVSALSRSAVDADAAGPSQGDGGILLVSECEQAPNPDSRITLAEERDQLGMRKVKLDWRLEPGDRHSLRRGHALLARALGASGTGRLKPALEDDDAPWPRELEGGRHHMGTTRMHVDPKRGVVDANARVHGIDNLYLAGSSVFPTSGAANPTLTIVALAIRLADRLKAVLS